MKIEVGKKYINNRGRECTITRKDSDTSAEVRYLGEFSLGNSFTFDVFNKDGVGRYSNLVKEIPQYIPFEKEDILKLVGRKFLTSYPLECEVVGWRNDLVVYWSNGYYTDGPDLLLRSCKFEDGSTFGKLQ